MEEAKAKEDAFNFRIFLINLLLGEIGESSFHVRFDAWGRLVGEFDGSVQDADRNAGWRLGRKQQPEIDVWSSSISWEGLQNLL